MATIKMEGRVTNHSDLSYKISPKLLKYYMYHCYSALFFHIAKL